MERIDFVSYLGSLLVLYKLNLVKITELEQNRVVVISGLLQTTKILKFSQEKVKLHW